MRIVLYQTGGVRARQAVDLYPFVDGNKAEDILVKVLLNEHEAILPVTPVQGPYYRWSDLRAYYEKKLATVIDWSVN